LDFPLSQRGIRGEFGMVFEQALTVKAIVLSFMH
jgi:hypothetical protein